jgi:uncharacterized paraquat-inducible protein A
MIYKIHLLFVAGTALAAFVMSSIYYMAFGKLRMKYIDDPKAVADMKQVKPWKMLAEFLRGSVIIYIMVYFFEKFNINFSSAISFVILLWIAFPVFLLSGSVLWDRRPWQLAVIHSGDWLLKLLLIACLLHLGQH